ncbi:MAG: hypothetical protein GX452_04460 [Ignavibacteriales bacterium]|nr:hypothetical protein [Ignavibacteriales bacterium]
MDSESLKKFQECSLKARTLKVTLPSGFEFDFILPTTGRFLAFTKGKKTQDDLIQLLQEGFPEGLNVEDLPLDDFNYLNEVISNFFEEMMKKKESQTGSETTQENS